MPDKRLSIGILILLIVNLLQAYFTPISEDEAYYWLWSQNLDWGYFDHPPMVAWWISVGYELFQNELGVRILTAILNSFSIYFLWKILNPVATKEIKVFWISVLSVPMIHFFSFITTPDAPLLFFTVFYLFSFKNFIEKNNILSTFLLSISFAGLMYSKYHGILVILFTLIPILKIWWKNPKFYLAVLGSLILYSPHLIWLFQNDFIPVRYHFLERSADEHFEFRKLSNYLLIYFLGAAPFLSYFIFKSIIKFKTENNFHKSVWWLCILPGVFFFFSVFKDNVQPQWLLISFLAMALVTYWHYAGEVSDSKFKVSGFGKTQNSKPETRNSKLTTQNIFFALGLIGIVLILILRILIAVPSLSPFSKNQIFAEKAGKFKPENPVFEKYQEASVYKFYNPESKAAVHRTLGNRKSQFTIWNWEENFYGKNVTYISPWVRAEKSFKGFKNRDYFLKEIPNYRPFDNVKIETVEKLKAKPNEKIRLKIRITNAQNQPVSIGENSDFQLNINYYKDLQYEIEYKFQIQVEGFALQPNESKELEINFKNIDKKGNFKACLGLNYKPVGTSYLSKPVEVLSN